MPQRHDVLADLASSFTDHIVRALARNAVRPQSELGLIAVRETFSLVAAVFDADGQHHDAEFDALIAALGPLTESTGTSVEDLRISSMLTDRKEWLERPSETFHVLVAQDRAGQTADAWTYYDRALHLAHVAAASDRVTSSPEMEVLARFEAALRSTLEASGLTRPSPDAALVERAAADLERYVADLRSGSDARPTLQAIADLAAAELARLDTGD